MAVWYCLVDAVALTGGPLLSRGLKNASGWLTSRGYNPDRMGKLPGLLGFQGHVREDLHAQIRLTSQAISTSLKNPDLAVELLDKTYFHATAGRSSSQLSNHRTRSRWRSRVLADTLRLLKFSLTHQGSTRWSIAGVTCARSPFTTGFSVVSMSLKSALNHRWPGRNVLPDGWVVRRGRGESVDAVRWAPLSDVRNGQDRNGLAVTA